VTQGSNYLGRKHRKCTPCLPISQVLRAYQYHRHSVLNYFTGTPCSPISQVLRAHPYHRNSVLTHITGTPCSPNSQALRAHPIHRYSVLTHITGTPCSPISQVLRAHPYHRYSVLTQFTGTPCSPISQVLRAHPYHRYLECCANGGQLPILGKQDRLRATQVMTWFNHMATSDEKVRRANLRGGGGIRLFCLFCLSTHPVPNYTHESQTTPIMSLTTSGSSRQRL
jgi:hypothetical protein